MRIRDSETGSLNRLPRLNFTTQHYNYSEKRRHVTFPGHSLRGITRGVSSRRETNTIGEASIVMVRCLEKANQYHSYPKNETIPPKEARHCIYQRRVYIDQLRLQVSLPTVDFSFFARPRNYRGFGGFGGSLSRLRLLDDGLMNQLIDG